jgi:hypothetical protein
MYIPYGFISLSFYQHYVLSQLKTTQLYIIHDIMSNYAGQQKTPILTDIPAKMQVIPPPVHGQQKI